MTDGSDAPSRFVAAPLQRTARVRINVVRVFEDGTVVLFSSGSVPVPRAALVVWKLILVRGEATQRLINWPPVGRRDELSSRVVRQIILAFLFGARRLSLCRRSPLCRFPRPTLGAESGAGE